MIDITIHSTPVPNTTASTNLLRKVSAGVEAFDTINSSDIAKSIFSIAQSEPTAIDIITAIVGSIKDKSDVNTIKNAIQNRGQSGVIWRFTSTKRFMIELDKMIDASGNYLALKLITMENCNADESKVAVRELVRFNKNYVKFFDKSNKYTVELPSAYNDLRQLCLSGTEDTVQVPPPVPLTLKEHRERVGICFINDDNAPTILVPAGSKVFFTKSESGKIYITDSNTGKNFVGFYGKEYDDALGDLINVSGMFDVRFDVKEFTLDDYNSRATVASLREDLINSLYTSLQHPSKKEEIIVNPDQVQAEVTSPRGLEVITDKETIVTEPDETGKTVVTVEPRILVKKGTRLTFIRKDDSHPDVVTMVIPDEKGSELEMTDPNFAEDWFKLGQYTAKEDITMDQLEKDSASEFMEHFSLELELHETPKYEKHFELPGERIMFANDLTKAKEIIDAAKKSGNPNVDLTVDGRVVGTVTVPQPSQQEEQVVDFNYIVEEPFKNASEAIISALNKIIHDHPEEDGLDITNRIRKMTELDNICVHVYKETNTYIIDDKPEHGWFPQEEVPTVDINDPKVQMGLLNGLFGTTNPAITHLQKFLRKHLTEDEPNPGFLATGTFPTETTIVWCEKPYDLTISIVKFKDGRFYRIMLAKTNVGLGDPGYIATKDIPDRWVRLGNDIQDRVEYRTDYRNRR